MKLTESYHKIYIDNCLQIDITKIQQKAQVNFHKFFFDFISFSVLCIFIILSTPVSQAQENKETIFKSADLNICIGPEYDSNILKYSEKYLEGFKRGNDEGRFHISTYDGMIIHSTLKSSLTFELIKNRETKVNFDYLRRTFINNNIKTWNQFSLGISQDITKKGDVKFFYDYIPYYYLRHYRDDDWVNIFGYTFETYQPQSFSKEDFGFRIQYTFFRDTRVGFSLTDSRYFYNEHFTEYDCTNFTYVLKVLQPIHKKTKLGIGLHYETSDIKNLDKNIYTLDHYSDASYKEAGIRFELNRSLPQIRKYNHNIEFNCSYERRIYTTNNYYKYDPIHAGRIDDVVDVNISYNIRIYKNLKLTAYYNRSQRFLNSSAEITRDFLMQERNYKQHLIGVLFTYDLKIKK